MLLSKMMGHSSVAITMDYIGITGEEIEALKAIRAQQAGYLEQVYADELAGIQKATELMNAIAQ